MMRSALHSVLPGLFAAALMMVSAAHGQDRSYYERPGERLLLNHCAMCHAIGRIGSSPHPRAPVFRDLAQRYPLESLAENLGEGLSSGHPEMPEFVFAPNDVSAIIGYLKSVQRP